MNKKGAGNPMIWVILFLVGAYLLWNAGFFDDGVPDDDEVLPSDLKTTVNLRFTDELATTSTAVQAEVQVFNGDGTYFTSASESTVGSDGLWSFDANVQTDYTLVVFDDSGQVHLPKEVEINTGTKSEMSQTIKLVKGGTLKVNGVDDPVDLDQNITGDAGVTEEFRVKWSVNSSNSGVRNPMIYLDTNDTTVINDIVITKPDSAGGKYSEVTCPDRISETAGGKLYCLQRDKTAYASDGVILTYFTIEIDETNAPTNTDTITPYIIDEFIYFEPGYDTIAGVKYDFENQADSDIGIGDSAAGDTIEFAG